MHVLLLPSWYSTCDKPWRGTFFKDQALALAHHGLRAGIAFVERRSLSRITPAGLVSHHFQITSDDEDGVPTLRMKGWSTFAQTTTGSMIWSALTRRLVRAYVAIHGVPDLIHGHAAMWGGYAAMFSARELGIPYVITEHSSSIMTLDLSRSDRRRVAQAYRNAARVLAVSGALKASVDCMAGSEVAEVIPNTVDTAYFHPPDAPRRRRPFVFLAIGDLLPGKRFDMLIRAFARLHRNDPATRLVVAGEGKERFRLRELTWALRIADVVELTGPLSRDRVRRQMWNANALVVPSAFETFGVVLIEALATGIPVVSTRCGGPEEIVTPNLGVLTDGDGEAALHRAMAAVAERDFRPASLRDSVGHRFGYEPVAQRLCDLYDNAAGRKREVA